MLTSTSTGPKPSSAAFTMRSTSPLGSTSARTARARPPSLSISAAVSTRPLLDHVGDTTARALGREPLRHHAPDAGARARDDDDTLGEAHEGHPKIARMDRDALDQLRDDPIDWRYKGFPPDPTA